MDYPRFQEPIDLRDFRSRGLLTTHEWWHLRNIEFFAQAWQANCFEDPLKPRLTTQICRCSVCAGWAQEGIPKFWIRFDGTIYEARFHPACLAIVKSWRVLTWL